MPIHLITADEIRPKFQPIWAKVKAALSAEDYEYLMFVLGEQIEEYLYEPGEIEAALEEAMGWLPDDILDGTAGMAATTGEEVTTGKPVTEGEEVTALFAGPDDDLALVDPVPV